mmetsp:Transcript_55911/g.175352  ORF Transcript_55911/g.175352 Transcript_55911/m.175352 type:complete len:552 (-) Transcript_55911:123-1778(-)
MDFDSLEEAEDLGGGEAGVADSQNVALHRPATASSSKGHGRKAGNAVDGAPATRWTSAYADGQWLAVDLGEVHELQRVDVRWEAAYASIYLVQGSLDGASWVTFASAAGREDWVETRLRAGSLARWVRILGQRRATIYGFSIWELGVFGSPRRQPLAAEPRLLWPAPDRKPDDPRLADLCIHVVGGLSGERLCDVRVDASDTSLCIREVKRSVGEREGTPPCEQSLVYGGRPLLDAESVCGLALHSGERLPAGAPLELTLALVRLPPGRAALLRELEQGALNIWDLPPDLQEEPDFVLAAVRRNVVSLKFAAEGARDDRDLVLILVRERSEALRYASERLRDDPEVVLAAVEAEPSAVQFASRALRCSPGVMLAAMRHQRGALRFAEPELLADPSFRAAAERTGVFRDTDFEHLLQVSVDEARDLEGSGGAVFLDARDESEFATSRLPGARHRAELARLGESPELQRGFREPGLSVVVYSDNGMALSRCMHLARDLRQNPQVQAGRVLRLTGGLNAWKEAGYPVEGDPRLMVRGHFARPGELAGLFDALAS